MRRVSLVVICLSITVYSLPGRAASVSAQPNTSRLSPTDAEQTIAGRSRQVILALKSRNLAKLSGWVHPRKGLRFSPYHGVNLGKRGDLVFSRQQVKSLMASKKRYGEPRMLPVIRSGRPLRHIIGFTCTTTITQRRRTLLTIISI
jgi:hypothetical protein